MTDIATKITLVRGVMNLARFFILLIVLSPTIHGNEAVVKNDYRTVLIIGIGNTLVIRGYTISIVNSFDLYPTKKEAIS